MLLECVECHMVCPGLSFTSCSRCPALPRCAVIILKEDVGSTMGWLGISYTCSPANVTWWVSSASYPQGECNHMIACMAARLGCTFRSVAASCLALFCCPPLIFWRPRLVNLLKRGTAEMIGNNGNPAKYMYVQVRLTDAGGTVGIRDARRSRCMAQPLALRSAALQAW